MVGDCEDDDVDDDDDDVDDDDLHLHVFLSGPMETQGKDAGTQHHEDDDIVNPSSRPSLQGLFTTVPFICSRPC